MLMLVSCVVGGVLLLYSAASNSIVVSTHSTHSLPLTACSNTYIPSLLLPKDDEVYELKQALEDLQDDSATFEKKERELLSIC